MKKKYNLSVTPEQRYWPKVDQSGGPNACWIWLGTKRNAGYGAFWNGERNECAHHYSYRIAHGLSKIPEGLYLCHSCDNPPCVNPAHLWLGTQKENIRDAMQKQRHSAPPHFVGDAHWRSRQKTCTRGHLWDVVGFTIRSDGGRRCNECERERVARRRLARLAGRVYLNGGTH